MCKRSEKHKTENERKMTFTEALKNGSATYEDIEKYIAEWHESPTGKSVYEFLGMTQQQYWKYLQGHIPALKQMFPGN